MNKKIKKTLISSLLIAGVMASGVYANELSTGSFSYGSFAAVGTLKTTWNFWSNDYGKARTDRTSKGDRSLKVTSYLEAEGTNKRSFDDGYKWAESNVTAVAKRFNSSHAIASASNKYKAITYHTLSDN